MIQGDKGKRSDRTGIMRAASFWFDDQDYEDAHNEEDEEDKEFSLYRTTLIVGSL